jgi:hypothetical protein
MTCSVADPECLSRITDPNFFIPDPGSKRFDTGCSSRTRILDTDQCCGSGMFIPDPGSVFFPSWIPDPNCLHPGSRIRIKEFKYFNPKKNKKLFLSSRKYDPGCSSQIPDPDADFLPIPDPEVKKAPDPGSGSATLIRILIFLPIPDRRILDPGVRMAPDPRSQIRISFHPSTLARELTSAW